MKKLLILVLALFALATMVALPFLPLTAEAPLVHAMAKDAVAVVRDAYPRAIKYGPPIVLVEDPAMSPLESSSPIFPKTTYQEDKAAYLRRIESGLNAMIFLGCLVVAAQVAIWFWWRSFIVKIELPRSMASVAPPNAQATNPGKNKSKGVSNFGREFEGLGHRDLSGKPGPRRKQPIGNRVKKSSPSVAQ